MRRSHSINLLTLQTDEMKALFDTGNAGLARRFPEAFCRFTFAPYTRAELRRIFADDARSRGLAFDFACADRAGAVLERESAMRNFGNADAAKKLSERLFTYLGRRARERAPQGTPAAGGVAAAVPVAVAEAVARAEDIDEMLASERPKDSKLDRGTLSPALRAYVDDWCRSIMTARALRRPPGDLPNLVITGPPVSSSCPGCL